MGQEKFITLWTFWKIIGIAGTIVGIISTFMWNRICTTEAKLDAYRDETITQLTQLKVDVSSIKSDMNWLKELFAKYQPE